MHTRLYTCCYGTKTVTVDDCDAHILDAYGWRLDMGSSTWYLVAEKVIDGRRKKFYLHRVIMGTPDGMKVDHKDGNGLNCVRSNMRLATQAQNGWNVKRKRGRSGYIGVHASLSKFTAKLKVNNKSVYLGTFNTALEAARAYDIAVVEHHGEFAVLNFPTEELHGKDTPISAAVCIS